MHTENNGLTAEREIVPAVMCSAELLEKICDASITAGAIAMEIEGRLTIPDDLRPVPWCEDEWQDGDDALYNLMAVNFVRNASRTFELTGYIRSRRSKVILTFREGDRTFVYSGRRDALGQTLRLIADALGVEELSADGREIVGRPFRSHSFAFFDSMRRMRVVENTSAGRGVVISDAADAFDRTMKQLRALEPATQERIAMELPRTMDFETRLRIGNGVNREASAERSARYA